MNNNENLIAGAYKAFNDRNIEAVLPLMHPDVQWPNGWEGGYVHGRNAVREYWQRQWKEVNPVVIPVKFHNNDEGQTEVTVRQTVKDLAGNLLSDGDVLHIYTVNNNLIERMEIVSTPAHT